MKNLLILTFSLALMASCCGNNSKTSVTNVNITEMANKKVLTAEEQSKLTPDTVIAILKQGNEAFASNNLKENNSIERVHDAVNGQYPEAVVLSCIDSRVPVEDIFQCGIGDIFVARVAGNIVNPDILGSLEYACKVSGSKLVVVMGHEHCGAIKSAINNVELGNITELLSKIKPAVEQSKVGFKGEMTSANDEFLETVCHTNIEMVVNQIRKDSPILKEMEDKGEIKIVGAMYHLDTGKVEFFNYAH